MSLIIIAKNTLIKLNTGNIFLNIGFRSGQTCFGRWSNLTILHILIKCFDKKNIGIIKCIKRTVQK